MKTATKISVALLCAASLIIFLTPSQDPIEIILYNNSPSILFQKEGCEYNSISLAQNYQSIATRGYPGSDFEFTPSSNTYISINKLIGKTIEFDNKKIYYVSLGTSCGSHQTERITKRFCMHDKTMINESDKDLIKKCSD